MSRLLISSFSSSRIGLVLKWKPFMMVTFPRRSPSSVITPHFICSKKGKNCSSTSSEATPVRLPLSQVLYCEISSERSSSRECVSMTRVLVCMYFCRKRKNSHFRNMFWVEFRL